MFNNDMVCGCIGSINPALKFSNKFFIRPVEDSKSFTGQVMTLKEFFDWRDELYNIPEGEFTTVNSRTYVACSAIKPIDYEVRFFIVDGIPVTWSEYKRGGTVGYNKYVEDFVIAYVIRVVGNPKFHVGAYQPEKAYVLDVAVTNGIPKILEANSINAVGLYAADTQKLIMAIEDLEYYL